MTGVAEGWSPHEGTACQPNPVGLKGTAIERIAHNMCIAVGLSASHEHCTALQTARQTVAVLVMITAFAAQMHGKQSACSFVDMKEIVEATFLVRNV